VARVDRLQAVEPGQLPVSDLGERRQRKDEALRSKQDVAGHWSVHVRTVERWVERGMPVAEYTWAGHPRFRLSEVADWHRRNRKQ
jgi:hypothetical protein